MNTRRISLQGYAARKDSNASLWLDKFITGQDETIDHTPKQTLIKEVCKINQPDIYKGFFKLWKESLSRIGAKFKHLKIQGRMVVGLGAEGVLETSIALHRTYGVPYIPGSAVKGLAATYAHRNLAQPAWRKGGKAHEFVFGSQDSAGFLTFYDALVTPETQGALQPDIMTVHHSEYYGSDNVAPADWDSPVPISFLSARGTYLVAISCAAEMQEEENWIKFVFAIVEKAMQEEGIGAKTSSGYGRGFFEKSEEDRANKQESSRVDEFVRRVNAVKNVAGEINTLYQDWKNLTGSARLKKIAAQAIVDRVREAGRAKPSMDKSWYRDLMQSASEEPK